MLDPIQRHDLTLDQLEELDNLQRLQEELIELNKKPLHTVTVLDFNNYCELLKEERTLLLRLEKEHAEP